MPNPEVDASTDEGFKLIVMSHGQARVDMYAAELAFNRARNAYEDLDSLLCNAMYAREKQGKDQVKL